MKGSEPVDIGGVDVRPPPQQLLHLLPVPRGTRSQEHAPVTEPDPPVLRPRLPQLSESLAVLPSLQLLGSLDQRRVGAGLEGHLVALPLCLLSPPHSVRYY